MHYAGISRIAALLCLSSLKTAAAHGRMTKPAARNGGDNGVVAGGPGTVHQFGSAGLHQEYIHGVCGNAVGTPQVYNKVGEIKESYTAGRVIEIDIQITAHHVGYFEVDLCLDAGNLSEWCFDQHHLLREGCECSCPDDPSNSCDACNECRWYWKALMEGELSQSVTAGYEGPVLPGFGNLIPYDYKMFYRLPAGVKSSQAVIRWHYMTTNSCTSGQSAPEEFWNCADVTIADPESGSIGPAIPYNNVELAAMAVRNLIPAIEAGYLKGVNYACPTSNLGALLGVGRADEYHCGEESNMPGPYKYCTSASGSNSSFDCTGIADSQIICQEQCGVWWFQCANMVAYLKPTAAGTKCKDNTFVLAAACDGYVPSPTPAPTSPDPTPSPPAPTPAPPTPAGPTPAPPTPTVSPTPAPTPKDGSCTAVPNNGKGCTDENCKKCATGYQWWPCNVEPACCDCSGPGPAPTPTPATPTPPPSPSPTSPVPPTPPQPPADCGTCTSCLADNGVCYETNKAYCDAFEEFLWCGGDSLVQADVKPKRRRRSFLQPYTGDEASMLQMPLEDDEFEEEEGEL